MLLNDYRGPAITRLRAGRSTDGYGDPVLSWAEADVSRKRLPGASTQPVAATEEDGVDRAFLQDVRRLFVRGRPDLTADDRVEILGDGVWRVDGDPEYRAPYTSRAYTVALLRRVTGRPAS